MAFHFTRLKIPEVVYIEPDLYEDERGAFFELFKEQAFKDFGIPVRCVQVNFSRSRRGVLRGLHYQKDPAAQAKVVNVIAGTIFDVAVDIRRGSPTYAQWVGVELTAEKKSMLSIPAGFAHGFCALSDDTEALYYCSGEYNPEMDRGIRWDDPDVEIAWPVEQPVLSSKDRQLPFLAEADNNFVYVDKDDRS